MKKGGKWYRKVVCCVTAAGLGMGILCSCSGTSASEESSFQIQLEGDFQPSQFSQDDVNSDTIRWMCSAYSIYTYYNDKEPGIVGGIKEEDQDMSQPAIRIALSQGWGIDGRKDVEPVLTDLLESGHRAEYRKVVDKMNKEGLLELSEDEAMANIPQDEDYYQYQAAYEAYEKYGEKGLNGWDYSRALQVLGDCYQAEYINLEECLELSLPIAQALQADYGSWEGVAESYLYGYQFWTKEDKDSAVTETNNRWEVYQELAAMKNGPYSVPYDTVLEDTWSEGNTPQAEEEQSGAEGDVLKVDEYLYVYVQAPEGFEEESFSDEEFRRYTKEREEEYGELRLSYRLAEYSEDEMKNQEEMALMLGETVQGNPDNQDVTVSELGERTVGDLTVHYVTYSYTYETIKTRYYQTWAAVDEDKILTCEVRETAQADGKLEYGDDGAVLDLAYAGITW